jgi:ribosomal protein L27
VRERVELVVGGDVLARRRATRVTAGRDLGELLGQCAELAAAGARSG